MPLRGTDPLQAAYENTLTPGGGSTSWETSYADPFTFLYPEADWSTGTQYEVWQNPATGEFQRRNPSPLPSAPPAPLPGPITYYPPAGAMSMGESEDPYGQAYETPPLPIWFPEIAPKQGVPGAPEYAAQPSGFESYLFERGLRDVAGIVPGVEETTRLAKGEPLVQGEGVWRALDIAATAADLLPFVGLAGDLGRAGINILRSSDALSTVASTSRRLAFSEQGAIPFIRLAPEVTDATVDAARRVLSNLPYYPGGDEVIARAYGVLGDTAKSAPERLLEAGRVLSETLPSGRPSFYAGDEYSLVRQAARREGLPAVNVNGKVVSTLQEVFHGTASPINFTRLEPQAGRPIFLSDSPWYAGNYMGVTAGSRVDLGTLSSGKPRLIKAFIKPGTKVVDSIDLPEGLQNLGAGADERAILQWMQDNGVDAIRYGDGKEWAVSNPDALLYDEYAAPTLQNLLKDEEGFLRFGSSANLPQAVTKALGSSKSLTFGDITRSIQEATTNRIAGLERSARKLGGDEVGKIVDEFNQVGSVVTKAAERSRIVYERVADIAARAGVRSADMPTFTEDVSKFLYAQTAATWRRLHPRAADRPFGTFGSAGEAAQWLATMQNVPGQAEIETAARAVADDHARIRDLLYSTGGLTKKAYTELTTKYPWYNPLKYTNIANDAALGNADALHTLGSLRAKIHELANDVPSHGEVVNPLESVFLANNSVERFVANNNFVRKSLDVMRRDPDMQGLVRKLTPNQTHNPDVERAVVMFNNGGVERWAVPKWAAGEIEHVVAHDADNEIIGFVNTLNKYWRTGAIEQNPAFIATNFILDHLNAYARAGTVPGTAIGEMVRYLRNPVDDNILRTFRLAGAEQSKFFSNATQAEKLKLAKTLQSEAFRNLNLADPEAIGRKIISFLPRMGRATEQGQRLKVFENTLDKALPGWKQMSPFDVATTPQAKRAATDALESIINYHRGGWLTRNLDRLIPFTNVAVQGTLLPLRIAQTPQGRWRMAQMGALMTGLTWYNNSYPENADVPAYIRYGTMYVMLPTDDYTADGKPKPNYIVLSPALRDWVPLQGLTATAIENFIAQSPTAGHGLMAQILANAPTGVGPGPVFDLAGVLMANWNFFREQPIVPESEQNLPPELQYGIATPRTYKEMGELLDMSPRTLQAVIESVGTGPAKTAVGTSDWILDTFFPEAIDQQIKQAVERISQMPPETRESLLTLLPSPLREQVERQSLKREPAAPIVGPIVKRFNPDVGGELERVYPRDEATRIQEMNQVLGVESIRTLRELGKTTPLMNETFSSEGHYTKLSDAQLAAAHSIYRDYLAITLAPMLSDPMFLQLKSQDYAAAEKLISKFLEQTESKIKASVLSPQQKRDLRIP